MAHIHNWNTQNNCGCGTNLANYVEELVLEVKKLSDDLSDSRARILILELHVTELEENPWEKNNNEVTEITDYSRNEDSNRGL